MARWSSGLRLRPLTPATAVRIRYGSPKRKKYGKHRIPNRVGVDSEEGPPVPIPNTVVKLFSAENTWRAAAREDKATPTFFYFNLCLNSSVGRTKALTDERNQPSGGRRVDSSSMKKQGGLRSAPSEQDDYVSDRSQVLEPRKKQENRICLNSSVGRARGC